MQIVINISNESYKHIIEQVNKRDYPDMMTGRAIAKGIPLPKEYKCRVCMHDAPYKWCCKTVCGESEFCNGCSAKSKMVAHGCPFDDVIIGADLSHK